MPTCSPHAGTTHIIFPPGFHVYICFGLQTSDSQHVSGASMNSQHPNCAVLPSAEPRETVEVQPNAAAPPKAVWTDDAVNDSSEDTTGAYHHT